MLAHGHPQAPEYHLLRVPWASDKFGPILQQLKISQRLAENSPSREITEGFFQQLTKARPTVGGFAFLQFHSG